MLLLLINGLSFVIRQITGLHVAPDQLSILVSLLLSLNGALFFKHVINPSFLSKDQKLLFTALFGVWLFFANWGWIIAIPLCEVLVSYLLFRLLPIHKAYWLVLVISMTGLSIGNVLIVYVRYNSPEITADFTGTIMIMTQRLTSYSCSLYDGLAVDEDKLSEAQKRHAIKKMPSFAEYFSYMFNFFGILVGPLVFFNDFMKVFSDEVRQHDSNKKKKLGDDHGEGGHERTSSMPTRAPIVRKLSGGLLMVVTFVIGSRLFPYKLNADVTFMETTPLLHRVIFLHLSLFAQRAKYYGVWLLGDCIFNAAGIGYTGRDPESGMERWDGVSNINIPEIEFASGMKSYIDNWNIMTVKWIRLVSYDRMPVSYRTVASFGLSAFWHGFFPGYYIMFATCHLYLIVQRKWRRRYRSWFQSTPTLRVLYRYTTYLTTQLAIAYSALPFVLLEWQASISFYRSLYFGGHLIGVGLLLFLHLHKGVDVKKSKAASTIVKQEEKATEKKRQAQKIDSFYAVTTSSAIKRRGFDMKTIGHFSHATSLNHRHPTLVK